MYLSCLPLAPCLIDPSKKAESAPQTHLSIEGHDTKHTVGQMLVHKLSSAALPFSPSPWICLRSWSHCNITAPVSQHTCLLPPPSPHLPQQPDQLTSCHQALPNSLPCSNVQTSNGALYTSSPLWLFFPYTPSPSARSSQLLGLNFRLTTAKHYALAFPNTM